MGRGWFGYEEGQSLDADYWALSTTSCVENGDRCRLDIFNQQVANKLVLTEGMRDRSEPFLTTDRLTVRLVSNEDIFLFKLIARRDDDIEAHSTCRLVRRMRLVELTPEPVAVGSSLGRVS